MNVPFEINKTNILVSALNVSLAFCACVTANIHLRIYEIHIKCSHGCHRCLCCLCCHCCCCCRHWMCHCPCFFAAIVGCLSACALATFGGLDDALTSATIVSILSACVCGVVLFSPFCVALRCMSRSSIRSFIALLSDAFGSVVGVVVLVVLVQVCDLCFLFVFDFLVSVVLGNLGLFLRF